MWRRFARHLYTLLQGALGLEDRRGELRCVGGLMLGLGLEGFGIYLEGLLYTWRRLLFDVGLVILEAYIWCPSFTMLSLEEFATCWRPWSWCPSFGGSCLWSATLGDDSWLMHLEAWRFLLWLFWRLMMLCFDLDEHWWLETLLHDDLETWHLTWWYLELDLKNLVYLSCLGVDYDEDGWCD